MDKHHEIYDKMRTVVPRSNYDVDRGELNPEINRDLLDRVQDNHDLLPPVIWEPFAGSNNAAFQNIANTKGIRLIAHGMLQHHPLILLKDSTKQGADSPLGGVLFHPPYPGSAPMSREQGEISLVEDQDKYLQMVRSAASLAVKDMVGNAFLYAAGRRYPMSGRFIRMDDWYLDIFEELELIEVLHSDPDLVLVFQK